MACSDGDSFTIDSDVTYDDSQSFNGCYDASADTYNDEAKYFLGGDEVGGTPVVNASAELHDDHGVWALAYFTTDAGFSRRCKDAAEEDSSTLHPADVLQWDCKDADDPDSSVLYIDVDAAVTITCGCDSPTPAPTATPAPTLGQTAPTFVPSNPSPEVVTESSSGEATPVGTIAGVVLAGVLVVGAVFLAFLFKTGRLKSCPGGSRNTPADDVVAPGSAGGSAPTREARVEATTGPTRVRYPIPYQYPAAV
ncbi:unnamed protein product [Ectocarpus sp. 4 AP-2014]